MKGWLLGLLMVGPVVLLVFPSLMHQIFGVEENVGTIGFMIGLTMIFLHSLVAVALLFTTLGKDMVRQDIWLHNPTPMITLVMSKIISSVLITTASLILISLITFAYLLMVLEDNYFNMIDVVKLLLFINGASILSALYVCFIGFFFWVMYQTLRIRLRFLAGPITVILFFLIQYWWDKMLSSAFFTSIFGFGEIPIQKLIAKELVEKIFNFNISMGVPVVIGEILFVAVTAILLLLLSINWFDKKVRV